MKKEYRPIYAGLERMKQKLVCGKEGELMKHLFENDIQSIYDDVMLLMKIIKEE